MNITIAQQCIEADDSYEFAVTHQEYKGQPSPFRKIFHFADGSYIAFKVIYEPAEAGRTSPCPLPNGI